MSFKEIPTVHVVNPQSELIELMFTYLDICESEGHHVNGDILNGIRYLSKSIKESYDTYVTEEELDGLECLIQDHMDRVGDKYNFWSSILSQIENRKELLEG